MLDIFKPRIAYGPFEYQWAYDAFELQNLSHWLPFEVNMSGDVNDFKRMDEKDKSLIGSVLKSFTINEVFVGNDYWSRIAKIFKKQELALMANAFSNAEGIHSVSYAYLDESLGLLDYNAFLKDPTAKAKIDRMMDTKFKTREDIALSIAIFSAFVEGVNLYSSFLILLNYSRFNTMKGLSQIISWSIMDEALHSSTGCKLFRTIIEENPQLWTDDFKKKIYDAARVTIELEDDFLTQAFSLGNVEGLTLADVKVFIRHRCNLKLEELGLKKNWKNLDQEALKRLAWYDVASNSNLGHQDFFAGRVTTYSKVSTDQNWDKIWDETDKQNNFKNTTKDLEGAAE